MKAIFLMALIGFSTCSTAEKFPDAQDPWLRAAPPNAKMMAAYVTLNNNSGQDWTLVGAYAPDFKMAEIHKTIEVDGMLKMREQKQLPLPDGESLTLQPGGLHVMLMMPKDAIKVGDVVKICLVYQDSQDQEDVQQHVQHLMFPVKKQ